MNSFQVNKFLSIYSLILHPRLQLGAKQDLKDPNKSLVSARTKQLSHS